MAVEHLGKVDCIVVGAGVVGLACARALALRGQEVLVLEAEARIGEHTSGRNSEVIHAGIYYPAGSLKAQLCVEGKHRLYDYLASRHVAHQRIGKLIIATTGDEVASLDQYRSKGAANGVDDLEPLDREQVAAMEPALKAEAGLLSPSTGILDSHAYMLALQGDLEGAGGVLAFGAAVRAVHPQSSGFELEVGQGEGYRVGCRRLVNAAGLGAWGLAQSLEGLAANKIPPCSYAKGHYMTYSGSTPFGRLVYPVAQAGGLGVHLTLDMAGQARFGPDVVWTNQVDYRFEHGDARPFVEAIRRYWPGIEAERLQPGYVGVRPKVAGPGEAAGDFIIQGEQDHGIPGLVQLFGIESPGLTASLAIGDFILGKLDIQ